MSVCANSKTISSQLVLLFNSNLFQQNFLQIQSVTLFPSCTCGFTSLLVCYLIPSFPLSTSGLLKLLLKKSNKLVLLPNKLDACFFNYFWFISFAQTLFSQLTIAVCLFLSQALSGQLNISLYKIFAT